MKTDYPATAHAYLRQDGASEFFSALIESSTPVNAGLVAVGDSIVNGFGRPLAGVPSQGFGALIAQALDLPYTRYAKGGYTSDRIVREFIPRVQQHYEIGVLSCGLNDAYQGLSLVNLEDNLSKALAHMANQCDRVVVLAIPISDPASEVVARLAAGHRNVLVVDPRVRGARLLRADQIHPTALGQMEIADRVAHTLGAPLPSATLGFAVDARVSPAYLAGHYLRLPITHVRKLARRLRVGRP